jgi:gluconolactonase
MSLMAAWEVETREPAEETTMTDIRTIATGLQFPEGPVILHDGSIALVEIARGTITRVFLDGRTEVMAEPGGGPNGLAIGPDKFFYVCNSGGSHWITEDGVLRSIPSDKHYTTGRIERIEPSTGKVEVIYEACDGHPLRGPNDLVFDREGGFYFTDLGKNLARSHDHGGVYYARPDGSHIVEVTYPALTPNGIGLSPDGTTLYVAEMEPSRLWAFDILTPGVVHKAPFPSPHGGRLVCGLPGYQGFDSLAVDGAGNIVVATLYSGKVTAIAPDGHVVREIVTGDPLTTNICFGGAGNGTAYVTLGGFGALVAMDWPEKGLPLAFGG